MSFIKHFYAKHPGVIRYLHNTSWMFTEQMLRIIAGLFVGVWVARYLGPEQFGIFSYALAFTALFTGIAKLGLDGIVIRNIVNNPEKEDIYLGTAFWLKLMGALLALGVVVLATSFTSNSTTTNTYIFIIASGITFQSFEVIDFYFQSKVLSKFVSLCKMTQLLLSSLLKIYFVLTGAGLIWFVLISLIDQITLAGTLVFAYKTQKTIGFYRYFDLTTAKKMLHNSWPLILSSFMVMIYLKIDQIMIKEMLGEYETGVYSAAVKISEMFYFIPIIINNSLFPAIINIKKISETLYLLRLQKLYTLMIWLAIGIALSMTFSSNWLVTLLYGKAYYHAGQVLMIHIWGCVFVFLSASFGKYLIVENLTKKNFYRTFVGAGLNVILNYIFIPRYGINGAAYATVFSLFVVNYLYDLFDPELHSQLKLKVYALFFIR